MPSFLVGRQAAPEPVGAGGEVEAGGPVLAPGRFRRPPAADSPPPSRWRLRLCGSSPWLLSSTITSPAATLGRESVKLYSTRFDAEPGYAGVRFGFGRRRRGRARRGRGSGRRAERRRRRCGLAAPPVAHADAPPHLALALDLLDDPLRVPLPGAVGGRRALAGPTGRARAPAPARSQRARTSAAATPPRPAHAFTSVGRAKPEAPGMIGAGVVAEPLLQQRAVHAAEVAGRAQVVVGVEFGQAGELADHLALRFGADHEGAAGGAVVGAGGAVLLRPAAELAPHLDHHPVVRGRAPRGRAGRRAAPRRSRAGCGRGRPPGRRGCRSRRRRGSSPPASAARRR